MCPGDLIYTRYTKEFVSFWTLSLFLCYKWHMVKKGRRATEEERLLAVQLMERGKPPEMVADILGVRPVVVV